MHTLISGITASGKSYLAKRLCSGLRRKRLTIVYDILGDDWNADFCTADAEKFLWAAQHNTGAALFIDESGAAIGRGVDARRFHWCATQSRHWGHRCFFIVQRLTQIEPIIRSQCSTFYAFRGSANDAKILVDDTGEKKFEILPTLPQYAFLAVSPFKEPKVLKIR